MNLFDFTSIEFSAKGFLTLFFFTFSQLDIRSNKNTGERLELKEKESVM